MIFRKMVKELSERMTAASPRVHEARAAERCERRSRTAPAPTCRIPSACDWRARANAHYPGPRQIRPKTPDCPRSASAPRRLLRVDRRTPPNDSKWRSSCRPEATVRPAKPPSRCRWRCGFAPVQHHTDSADLPRVHAGVGARDVEETGAVQGADLNVFDRGGMA